MTLRPLQATDFEQWLPLWQAYQDFYEVDLAPGVSTTLFQRCLDAHEPVHAAVAVIDGRLAGLVHYVVHRSTWAIEDFCYLEDLYVDPAVRGSGAGKRLIEWVQAFAQQHSCGRLYWHTHHSNARAQKLYDWVAAKSGCIEYRLPL
ncbi:MAG: GNAT family N-acetyltransferase [Neisseriaceae bacterium]|nr:GNAT family N-acetyltransferase [Neisseriaceae bacterium]MBP6861618.1 GNAT family N-acetyltransferase [Neisseriaceae bacterium]